MEYNLTEKQQEGLNITWDRFQKGEPYTIIGGYAGTGKTYLVNAIVDWFNRVPGETAFATFTGKAANVLRSQGKKAITLHKLLYKTHLKPDGSFIHVPKRELDENYKMIVVDEISMCPKEMWELLLKHGVYVIALGDPFQLPPIGEPNGLLDNPHIFLDKVMRQALESDIIKVSMQLREGKELEPFDGNDIKIIRRSELLTGMYSWADQIICGRNDTRRQINKEVREYLGYKGVLAENEKIICLKNYWEFEETSGFPLINGLIGTATNISSQYYGLLIDFTSLNNEEEHGRFGYLDTNIFTEGHSTFSMATTLYEKKKILQHNLLEFDYGYCITCWKAQGSQFDKVLFFAEKVGHMTKENYDKYLYTGITRASKKIIVVIP